MVTSLNSAAAEQQQLRANPGASIQEGKDSLMQSQNTLILALGKGETEGAAGVMQASDKGKGKGHDQY